MCLPDHLLLSESGPAQQQQVRKTRPKSAVLQAVEDKVFLLDELRDASRRRETRSDVNHHMGSVSQGEDSHSDAEDEDDDEDGVEDAETEEQQYRAEYDSSSHC